MTIHLNTPDLLDLKPKIAVIGVGGAGGNAVNNMIAANLQGVSFVVANTDAQALSHSQANAKIQLGVAMTEGLGAGSKPEIGAAAAEESIEEIRAHLRGLHMVFITAGMGGGTGTGAAPVIAAAARHEGVLTVGVVTKPFHFEGQRRMRSAEFGIELLAEQVDTLIVIPNQNLFRIAVMKTTFSEAFAMADQVLHDGISCITDVMVKEGIINLDFADVNLIMRGSGTAMMGTGGASGENRGREAAEAAISNPLLDDVTLQGAKGLLVSIIGGRDDLTLYEVDEAANRVRDEVHSHANIIVGTAFDETLAGSIRVSVVATGLDGEVIEKTGSNARDQQRTHMNERGGHDQSLASRLTETVVDKAEVAVPSGQEAVSVSAFQQQQVVDDIGSKESYGAQNISNNGLELDDHVSGEQSIAFDKSVRMPEIDDFSSVAQALLRDQGGDAGESPPLTGGIETFIEKAGFFKKLAGLARGHKVSDSKYQTVANQSQVGHQMLVGAERIDSPVFDPHVKGAALSPHQELSASSIKDVSEDVEFPSFLRKYS